MTRRLNGLRFIALLMALSGVWTTYYLANLDSTPSEFQTFVARSTLIFALLTGGLLLVNGLLWFKTSIVDQPVFLRGSIVVGVLALILSPLWVLAIIELPDMQILLWGVLIWLVGGLIVFGLLLPHRAPYLALMVFSLLFTCSIVEGGTRLMMRTNPYYREQIIQPHPIVGWKYIPNYDFTWMGFEPTCISFRIPIHTNSLGYIDREHSLEKPADTIRIAVLGDSFIEAMQVPYEARATQVFERLLNENPPQANTTYEVLNFGISANSIGQSMLIYEQDANTFQPDYVFQLLSEIMMERVKQTYLLTIFDANAQPVNLRPNFVLTEGQDLYTYPLEGYPVAKELFESRLNSDGTPKRDNIYLAPRLPTPLDTWLKNPFFALTQHSQAARFLSHRFSYFWFITHTNLFKIEQSPLTYKIDDENRLIHRLLLQRLDADTEAQLVLIDDLLFPENSSYFEALSQEQGWGYVRIRDKIQAANLAGEATRFLCDNHYNERGQEIFGQALYDWFQEH